MTSDTLFGLIGGFISVLVSINVFLLQRIQKQLDEAAGKLESKLSIIDFDKQTDAAVAIVRVANADTYKRFDDRITAVDHKLCCHGHTPNGEFVPYPRRKDS